MCCSATAAVLAMMVWGVGSTPPIVTALSISLLTLVLASLWSRPPDSERLSRWERRLAGVAEATTPADEPGP
jgi:hypothetical protein